MNNTVPIKETADYQYLNTCIQFFHIWAMKSQTPVFYKEPENFLHFKNEVDNMEEDKQFKFLVKILEKFQKESLTRNPLDTFFSLMTEWNVNYHLVIKDFIPYIIKVAPHVKFKRTGCMLQTNNNFYLFAEVFKNMIVQTNWNNQISNSEILEDLITVYITFRYRQIHGEKDFTHFEEKLFKSYNRAMEETNKKTLTDINSSFAAFRAQMLNQKISNENLFNALKELQNLLGKNAMTSTKKETFFWQMYSDLQCVDKHNYVTPFQEKFFLSMLQYSNDNKIYIVFNKEYFKAVKQTNFIERIGCHRVAYIYILYNLAQKLNSNYETSYSDQNHPLVDALLSAESIFQNFTPYIEEMEDYLRKNSNETSIIYPQLIDTFNEKFSLNNISSLDKFINFGLKEQMGILNFVDRKKLYKGYL